MSAEDFQTRQAAGAVNGNKVQTITFQYDNANRGTQMVLTNGVTVSYGYDNANELTSITYARSNGTLICTLTYAYDAAGHRVSVGATLANVVVPTTTLAGTSYLRCLFEELPKASTADALDASLRWNVKSVLRARGAFPLSHPSVRYETPYQTPL